MKSGNNPLPYDVARCSGVGCKIKNECRRFTTQMIDRDGEMLWYVDPAYNKENNKCDFKIASK